MLTFANDLDSAATAATAPTKSSVKSIVELTTSPTRPESSALAVTDAMLDDNGFNGEACNAHDRATKAILSKAERVRVDE